MRAAPVEHPGLPVLRLRRDLDVHFSAAPREELVAVDEVDGDADEAGDDDDGRDDDGGDLDGE